MEDGTEELLPLGSESERGKSPAVEDIYERIAGLARDEKAQLIYRLIRTLTTDEMADVLDEVSARFRNADSL